MAVLAPRAPAGAAQSPIIAISSDNLQASTDAAVAAGATAHGIDELDGFHWSTLDDPVGQPLHLQSTPAALTTTKRLRDDWTETLPAAPTGTPNIRMACARPGPCSSTRGAATLERVAAMPAGTVDVLVGGEWSCAQTLRHLVMATDVWLGRAILEVEQPFHQIGQPNAEY